MNDLFIIRVIASPSLFPFPEHLLLLLSVPTVHGEDLVVNFFSIGLLKECSFEFSPSLVLSIDVNDILVSPLGLLLDHSDASGCARLLVFYVSLVERVHLVNTATLLLILSDHVV